MDLNDFQELLTPHGQAALATAGTLHPTEASFLTCFEKLRKAFPAPLAKAALETAILRAKAHLKFPNAARMYFTREALEQSSGHVIAGYRAQRFAGFDSIADLGCGIGGDTLGLASAVPSVVAVELDPVLAGLAKANVAANDVADRVRVHAADLLTAPLPGVTGAFADPARRSAGRRFLALADYLPPPAAIRERFPPGFPLAFKVAPGLDRNDLQDWDAEAEFISVAGELKECVLWCGPLRTTGRRATLLPGPHTLFAEDPASIPDRPPSEPGEFLFDPNPALVRAELEAQFAEENDLAPLDSGIAMFTGSHAIATPFAACYRVEQSAPFHLGRLRDYLRERQIGRVTVLKRASDLDANEVMKKLKLEGAEHRHLILTRSLGKPYAIVAEAVS